VIHINTDWRGRAKPGPWYGRYYEDWDAAHHKAWVRGQAVPGRDKIPLTDKLDPTDTGVMRLQFRQIR